MVRVAPSRFESFGLIYVEGMMYARPVVALRSGAVPEIVEHGVDGVLVDEETAAALADALSARHVLAVWNTDTASLFRYPCYR